jgi:hypothetical protein
MNIHKAVRFAGRYYECPHFAAPRRMRGQSGQNMEVFVMRELTTNEVSQVSGGGVCVPENTIAGVSNFNSIGNDLINFYEGLVAATSHVIERVANAW